MPTLIDFRRRIRSVKNTQQITRAMKFVAAAKLRRAQEAILAARPYARQVQSVIRSAAARIADQNHPLLAHRPEKRILVLLVTGDKGLCGAFNTNVLRRGTEFFREHPQTPLEVVAVGRKGRDSLRKRRPGNLAVVAEHINLSVNFEFARVKPVAEKAIESFAGGHVDAVYAVYNEFKSAIAQRVVLEKILPIDPLMLEDQPGHVRVEVDYLYEQPPAEILSRLLPRYVEAQVYRIVLESAAAEHGARMTAMDAATKNAGELIDKVTLHMNKVRQAAITREIIEVVSGAASTA